MFGNQATIRGKAKYLGGVGTKVTGISRRKFRPNLQNVHVTTANGTRKTTTRLCAVYSQRRYRDASTAPRFQLPKTVAGK